MPVIEASHDYTVNAESIWGLLVDFGNIEAWWPTSGPVRIARVELEGKGVGMVRHIFNEGMPAPVSERLDGLDEDSLTWQLSIVGERPAGLLQYQATGTLAPLPRGGCRMAYRGEFEAAPGREEEAREFLKGAYALMFDGLEQATRR
ncbi:SRPBCC family protein [Parahaliea aestuarii]|uniref:SRPBCC family protein n=1 Tax=Parahaliea aestuarii TaxID=1852021 RepID=A0A5C9A5N1_9GAMM|nr:SRPBCC family protein [Parahaliea aestuarii]TXS95060.1 SRPBCC family protein [Parahaliea aestuarii]